MYTVEYSSKALKALQKLDRQIAAMIYGWIEKNLIDCLDPRLYGKPLVGNKKGYWRYRVGSYRIIAEIHDHLVRVDIINVAHRSNAYD